jgi:hypothetical protein
MALGTTWDTDIRNAANSNIPSNAIASEIGPSMKRAYANEAT